MSVYSAEAAYFMFFSLIPLIMLLLSLINRFDTAKSAMASVYQQFTPAVVNPFVDQVKEIVTESRMSLTIVSAVVLLWSASKVVFSIIGGMNSVYEIKETRNYFLLRLLAMIYTVAFIVIIVAALLLMVFGESIGELISSYFPRLKGIAYIISSLRYIIGFVVLVCFFSLVYKMLPNGKQKFSDQIPGAVLAGAGWVSFSILFAFFVDNFSNYALIYGSLTAVIVLMLWLYVCMYIMFLGAEVNRILSSTNIHHE